MNGQENMWSDHFKRKGKEIGKSPQSEWWSLFCKDEVVSVLPLWWIKAMGLEADEWLWRGPASSLQLSNSEQVLPRPWVSGSLSLIGQGWTPRILLDLLGAPESVPFHIRVRAAS